jgi:Xaa-Pro aminopeptidase
MFNISVVQSEMQKQSIDLWLIYDFRGSNPIFWQAIGQKKSTTRRSLLLIPDDGEVILIVHIIDKELFSDIDIALTSYTSWQELHSIIKNIVRQNNKIAIEYSPNASIPTLSWVDAGTVELLQSFGANIVSSSNLFQMAASYWTKEGLESHLKACADVAEIKNLAFAYIRDKIFSNTSVTEFDVQQFIIDEFRKRNMETEDFPIVAINQNSASPHYEPSSNLNSTISQGDWVLIDLWARYPGDHNIFSDITWVAYVGKQLPDKYYKIFNIVKNARDAVVARLKEAWESDEVIEGWQLDDVARSYITKSGYGNYFLHRTGHSIGPGSSLHALGVNLDNLETHDTRAIIPGIGFSVEPGIYLDEFGVRLEINVYVDPLKGPIVTTPIQNEIIILA